MSPFVPFHDLVDNLSQDSWTPTQVVFMDRARYAADADAVLVESSTWSVARSIDMSRS